jgi:hypothetical protein
MAAPYEDDIDAGDTQVDLQPDGEDGGTQPFNEVARAEAALERSRERVERSVSALRDAFARRTDWRAWVAQRPVVFVGAALLLGFMWGYRRPSGRSSNRR